MKGDFCFYGNIGRWSVLSPIHEGENILLLICHTGLNERGACAFRLSLGVAVNFQIVVIQPAFISLGIPEHGTHQPLALSGMTTTF